MIPITPEAAVALAMLVCLTIYALLGGADFGAGVWNLTAVGLRGEAQHAVIAHAIGPVWEANHVWLIIVLVLLFTGFPPAFAAILTVLHVPISRMLIGIVLRGSAFTFRSYDNTYLGRRRWNRAFVWPSLATPLLLGAIIGAIATGRVGAPPGGTLPLFFLLARSVPGGRGPVHPGDLRLPGRSLPHAGVDRERPLLREDFRRRALAGGVVVGLLAFAVYLLARREAPLVFRGLDASPWGLPVRITTGLCATLALAGLWWRRYHAARILAIAQVTLILWGCALAQHPYLVPPRLTGENAAAPPLGHQLLLAALGAGSLILLPSLSYLFRVFKRHTFVLGRHGDREGTRGAAG